MPRLMILWTRPQHLEPEEGDDWVRSQTVGLRAIGARAAEVQSAAFEHPASWHWVLELEVDDAAGAERSLRSGFVADWVRELRQLKMRPTVMLVADRPGLGPAA